MEIKEKVHVNRRRLSGGGYSLHLDYRIGGKRVREFLKLYLVPQKTQSDKIKNEETMRLAVEMKNRRIRELDAGDLLVKPAKRTQAVLAADYLGTKIGRIESDNYRRNNEIMLKALIGFSRNVTLAEIDREFFRRFMGHLVAGGLSRNSAHLYGVMLKARLHEAAIDGMIPQVPDFYGLLPKKENREVDFLTLDELKAMLNTDVEDYIRRPFMFSCFTGLRHSDVMGLKWEDFDGNVIVKRMKKTGEIVRVPLSANAEKFLPERKPSGRVFERVPLNTLSRHLKEWAIRSGLKKNVHFHMARHSFGTLALEHGADIYTVSKLMGHRSISTTQIYAKVLDAGRKKAVDAIPEI